MALMSIEICGDGCIPGAQLTVELGLLTPGSSSAIWDLDLWNTGFWGTGAVRTDVSQYVRAVSTDRQFTNQMRDWSAGSVQIVLHNRDGRFSPDNLEPTAPYVAAGLTGIRPGCPIWVTMTYAGTSYPIFTGYANKWLEGWALHSPADGDAYMTVSGYDDWGRIGRVKKKVPIAPIGDGDTYGQRVARILASAGFTGPTVIDVGETTMIGTDLSQEPVSELGKVAQSEGAGAAIWAEADGSIVAKGRYSLIEDLRSSVVQVQFGDSPGDIPWIDIITAPVSDDGIVNRAVYARTGGIEQEYSDPRSIALYGQCDDPDSPSDLLCETDGQVAAVAQWAVMVGKDPESRVEAITLNPRVDLTTIMPVVLYLKIRDLVAVRLVPPSATGHVFYRRCFVSGLSFDIAGNNMTVKVSLETATAYARFAGSLWDSARWGANDVDADGSLWFV